MQQKATTQMKGSVNNSYAWYVVAVLLLTSIMGYIDRLVMGFLIEPIKAELSLSDTQMGMLNGFAFTVFYVLMGLPLGRMADTFNRKYLLSVCITLWSAMTALCGLASSYVSMFLARVGVGVGEAGLNPSSISIIGDLFSKENVTKPVSVFTLSFYIGGGLAIMLGGKLVEFFASMGQISLFGFDDISGWRLVFIIVGLLGFICVFLLLLTVKEPVRGATSARSSDAVKYSLKDIFAYMKSHKMLYFWLYGGLLLFGFYMYSIQTWYAAMMMRNYAVTPGEISTSFGLTYLVCGVIGALCVSTLVAFWRNRGIKEAPITVCSYAIGAMLLPALLGPLMPTLELSIAMFGIVKFCWAVTITVSLAAVAIVTPSAMRGLMVSVYMVLMNITGGAFGATIVGLLSDHVFGEENLRYAIMTMAAVVLPLSITFFVLGRAAFRKRVIELEQEEK